MCFLIGVAGDSGTGKSKFAELLKCSLKEVGHISLDDYHKYSREERKTLGITPLNPKANDFKLMYKHLKSIKQGKEIIKPVYDHSRGVIIKDAEHFVPKRVVIVEGLLPFYYKRLSKLFDLKIFFDISEELKLRWKIQRDKTQRHYKKEFDLEQRKVDYVKYVLPQKHICDIIFEVFKESNRDITTKIIIQHEQLFNVFLKVPIHKGTVHITGNEIVLNGRFGKENFFLPKSCVSTINSFTAGQILLIEHLGKLLGEDVS